MTTNIVIISSRGSFCDDDEDAMKTNRLVSVTDNRTDINHTTTTTTVTTGRGCGRGRSVNATIITSDLGHRQTRAKYYLCSCLWWSWSSLVGSLRGGK